MKRPLVWVAVAMACGAYAGAFGWTDGAGIPLLLCLAGVVPLLVLQSRRIAQPLAIALMFFGAGGLLWEAHHAGPFGDGVSRWAADRRNAFVELVGTVHRPDLIVPGREYASFILDVVAMRRNGDQLAIAGRTHVRWYAPAFPLSNGDRVRVRGKLLSELGHVNPGVQDVEDYLRRRGVHTALAVRDGRALEVIDRAPWWLPMAWASRLRHAEAERLRPVVPESIYPFILAVWLGDRREIPESETEAYIVSGTAHILAVSGVHMAILYVSVAFLLKMIWPTRVRLRALITLGVVFLFAALTGARVSSMRAACMIALYLLAEVLDREPDAPTALGLAGILFVTTTPGILLDAGFLLSFSSVASLLLFREPVEAWLIRATTPDPMRRLVDSRRTVFERAVAYLYTRTGAWMEVVLGARRVVWGARGGLSTALTVQILPLPLAIHFFHIVPLAGPLMNLAVVPLVGVVLWMCLLTTIAAFVAPPVAMLFGHALLVPVWTIQGLAALATKLGAYAIVTSPTAVAFALYWTLALLVLASFRRQMDVLHRRWAMAGWCVACLLAWNPIRAPGEVVFLDVGHGDAAFIRTPNATTMLVDAGDRSEYVDCGKRQVAPFLWANHVRRLDYIIITHADRDHVGGARYILDRFAVGHVLLNATPTDRALEQELLAQCEDLGVPVQRLVPGDRVRAGNATLAVLHPPPQWPAEPVNEASLVLKLAWPGMDVLLAGDVEDDAERALLGDPIHSTVLKVPHHGSRTSSTAAFIDGVQPKLAIVTGEDRSGRGMQDAVLDRYRQRGIPLLRTDIHGAITLRAGHGRLDAQSERPRRGYLATAP